MTPPPLSFLKASDIARSSRPSSVSGHPACLQAVRRSRKSPTLCLASLAIGLSGILASSDCRRLWMLPLALPLEDRIVAPGVLIHNPEHAPQRSSAATAALFRIVGERLTGSGFSEED